jgi:xanthine dehydrogenase/oxidase
MYKNGDTLPFGMVLGEQSSGKWNVPTMWDRLYEELGIPDRRTQIDEFNAKSKWTKRGLSVIPTKFGIAFTAKYMVREMFVRIVPTSASH